MFLRKIVLALMAFLVFSIPLAGGRLSFDLSLGPLGLMSIVGLLAFLFAIASLLFGHRGLGRTPVPMDLSITLFGIFVALNFASVGWAEDSGVAISKSTDFIQVFIFVWLLLFLRFEPKSLSIILHAFFLGSVLLVGNALYDIMSIGLDVFERQRIGGLDIHVNRFAFKLALGIPVAFYLSQRGFPGLRWVYLAYVPAAVFLAFLSGSRTGTVATLFALMAGAWLLLKVENHGQARFSTKRALVLGVVGIIVAVSVVPYISDRFAFHAERVASVADPLDTAGRSSAQSGLGGRLHLWEYSLAAYLENPLLGVGSGGSRTAMLDYIGHEGLPISLAMGGRSVHSAYIAILTETGAVGMLLYFAVIASLIIRIRSFPRQEALLFLSLMGVGLITALAMTNETVRDFNLALFMSVIFLHLKTQSFGTPIPTVNSRLTERPRAQTG